MAMYSIIASVNVNDKLLIYFILRVSYDVLPHLVFSLLVMYFRCLHLHHCTFVSYCIFLYGFVGNLPCIRNIVWCIYFHTALADGALYQFAAVQTSDFVLFASTCRRLIVDNRCWFPSILNMHCRPCALQLGLIFHTSFKVIFTFDICACLLWICRML